MENISPANNPLLDFSGPPHFSVILPEHIGPALDHVLDENRRTLNQLLTDGGAVTWDNFAQPIEDMRERLARMWSSVAHLHAVMDSEALRMAYNAGLPKITDYYTELAQDERVYAGYKAIAANVGFSELTMAQKKIIENTLR
ncbi:MAG: oligopeptidase A, partial [Gammaproteobacteria bacterium]|nr:oligopeptidase A [Gammaproteobacteria bacterium]